jgi:hypothetical protein
VQADGSFRNDVTILPSMTDTTETGDSIESTGRRIFRSDNARPIRSPTTGGGSIDLSWREPVTVVATGSGLTASQDAALTKAAELGALVEGTTTAAVAIKNVHRVAVAKTSGFVAGQACSPVFRNLADDADAITSTQDANGNRTAVTVNA